MLLRAHSHLKKEWPNTTRYAAQTLGVKQVLKQYRSALCLFFREKLKEGRNTVDWTSHLEFVSQTCTLCHVCKLQIRKREIIWYSIAILTLSQNRIKINKNYHLPSSYFITKNAFDILTPKIKNIILKQSSVLPKECRYIFSSSIQNMNSENWQYMNIYYNTAFSVNVFL